MVTCYGVEVVTLGANTECFSAFKPTRNTLSAFLQYFCWDGKFRDDPADWAFQIILKGGIQTAAVEGVSTPKYGGTGGPAE